MSQPKQTLTEAQKQHLRRHAHPLKPVVIIGDKGLTDNVIAEIDAALTHHELIKVRINGEDRADRRAVVELIGEALAAAVVQEIGHIAVLFRRNREKPKIALPH